jgi:hypothetical protein
MAGLGVLVDMGVSIHVECSFSSPSCLSTRTKRFNVGSHKYARYFILIYQMAITLLLRQSGLMSWKGADIRIKKTFTSYRFHSITGTCSGHN